MRTTDTCDFAIVGAGLTGVAIAYGLARLGKSVVVLERRDQSQSLEQPNHGLLWAQGTLSANNILREWNNLALSQWNAFDEQLCQIGASVTHYERSGGVWITNDNLALQGRRIRVSEMPEVDSEFEWLDAETLGRLINRLSGDVVGASYCADDGQLNLRLLHRAFGRALDNLGVERAYLSPVTRVTPDSENFVVCGEGFELSAHQVVLACGGQSPGLAQSLGFDPIRTVVDTLWETAAVQHFMPFPAWQIRQSRDGALYIPVEAEEDGNDENWLLAQNAIPDLKHTTVRRRWLDTRCETPEGQPIYERSSSFPGAYRIANPQALLHCPLQSSLLPAWLVGKLGDAAMAPFCNQRASIHLHNQDTTVQSSVESQQQHSGERVS